MTFATKSASRLGANQNEKDAFELRIMSVACSSNDKDIYENSKSLEVCWTHARELRPNP